MFLLLAVLAAAGPETPVDGECPEEPPTPLASPQAEASEGEQWARSLFLLVTPEAHMPVTLVGSLGAQLARGNREVLRLAGDLTLLLPVITPHLIALTRVRGAYEDAFQVRVAQRAEVLQRVDAFFAERSSVFAAGAWVHDPFLGIRTRWVGLLGVGHEVVLDRHPEHPKVVLRAGHIEVGGFVAREYTMRPLSPKPDLSVGNGINDLIGPRVAGYYYQTLDQRSAVGLESQLVVDALELSDLVIISTAFIQVALWGPTSLRVFLTHRFDGMPAPGVSANNDLYAAVAFSVRFEAESSASPPPD